MANTIDRNEAIKRIRAALRARSGKAWSVTGDRGTAWGWIKITAPPRRQIEHGYMSDADRAELARLLDLDRPCHQQGQDVPPDERYGYVLAAEGGPEPQETFDGQPASEGLWATPDPAPEPEKAMTEDDLIALHGRVTDAGCRTPAEAFDEGHLCRREFNALTAYLKATAHVD